MAQLNSFDLFNKKYSELSQKMRDTIEKDVKFLLEENKRTHIIFKESVLTHLISDNCYSDCRGIEMIEGGGLVFHIERNMDGIVDEYEEGLEEMDASSYYEILLALNEKSYIIE